MNSNLCEPRFSLLFCVVCCDALRSLTELELNHHATSLLFIVDLEERRLRLCYFNPKILKPPNPLKPDSNQVPLFEDLDLS